MAQSNGGIGKVIPNTELALIAMSYARSRFLCGADALGDEVRSADDLAKACQADADALCRLLRAQWSAAQWEAWRPEVQHRG